MKLPPFARQFIFDAIQGVILAVIALNVAIPNTLDEAKAQALIVASAAARAGIAAVASAAARAVPAFFIWLGRKLDVESS